MNGSSGRRAAGGVSLPGAIAYGSRAVQRAGCAFGTTRLARLFSRLPGRRVQEILRFLVMPNAPFIAPPVSGIPPFNGKRGGTAAGRSRREHSPTSTVKVGLGESIPQTDSAGVWLITLVAGVWRDEVMWLDFGSGDGSARSLSTIDARLLGEAHHCSLPHEPSRE